MTAASPFGVLDPVSWPGDVHARSKRHLVGAPGTPPDGRGAQTICGKRLPPGTARDDDEGRGRCVACWRQLARHGAAFYAERPQVAQAAADRYAALRGGDSVVWRVQTTSSITACHIVASAPPGERGLRTVCGRPIPATEVRDPADARGDCVLCRAHTPVEE